jgi:hypothetical protein
MKAGPVIPAAALLLAACMGGNEARVFAIDGAARGFDLPASPVILFFVDGLRADVLEDLAQSGDLPRLQRHLFERGARVRSAVTSVPSVTYPNAVTMLTGCWPSNHHVWSNACFERHQLLVRNYETQREWAAYDGDRATLFELLPQDLTAGIALPFQRGAKISRAVSLDTGGAQFGVSWAMGQKERADELLCDQLCDIGEQVRRIGHWPALVQIHLPGVDAVGHAHGSDGGEYRQAVENLDHVIGDVLETFARGGMLEQLTIVLTSDHGHHTTPHSLPLEQFLTTAIGAPVLFALENNGDASFIARWEQFSEARVVVAPNGRREASLHLRTGESWNDRPSLESILAFPGHCGGPPGENLPSRLLRSPAIDLVAVHDGEHDVRVYGRSGTAVIRRMLRGPEEPSYRYEILAGRDPLGYDADARLSAWMLDAHASREWLAATADQRRPDLVPQLMIAFDDCRSGDVILFAAPAWDFSEELYAGGHGGVEREEMLVPFYLAGPGIRAGAEVPCARLVDLVPTLLDLTGVHVPASARFDGISLAPGLR